jgi:hypothetical protein
MGRAPQNCGGGCVTTDLLKQALAAASASTTAFDVERSALRVERFPGATAR